MNKKAIEALVRQERNEILKNLSAQDLFTSAVFGQYMHNLVDSITGRYQERVKLNLYYDENDDTTAYTDGDVITANLGNKAFIQDYLSLDNQFLNALGLIFHETAHILYTDFDLRYIMLMSVSSGHLYGSAPRSAEKQQEEFAELLQSLKTTQKRILTNVYSEIFNQVEDPRVEASICRSHGKLIKEALLMNTDVDRRTLTDYESMKKKCTGLERMYAMILQYARFGEVYMKDPSLLEKDAELIRFQQIMPVIDEAKLAKDSLAYVECINEIVLFLWPYIKGALNDSMSQQGNLRDSHKQGSPLGPQGAPNSSSDCDTSQMKHGASSDHSTQHEDAERKGKEGDKQESMDQSNEEMLEKAIQAVMDQLKTGGKNGGLTQAPQGRFTNDLAKQEMLSASEHNASSGSGQTSDLKESMKQELAKLMEKVAQEKAEEEVDKRLSEALSAEIRTVNQSSSHKGRPVYPTTAFHITDQDKDYYHELYDPLRLYSKRLQKNMREALRDLEEGEILHKRYYGNVFEARNAYRPDQRYFGQKKQPKERPEMAISVLVDNSGSMAGDRIDNTMRATILLQDFAKGLDIPLAIARHNAHDGGISYIAYQDFDSFRNADRYKLVKMKPNNCNRDGMAIEVAANLLAKRSEAIRLMIIISDGQPNDGQYGGKAAAKDIQSILKKYRRQGIEFVAAAIGNDKDKIAKIYGMGSFLDISDLETFPKKLVKLVAKRFV